ncbi:VIT domain-containing protein [Dokdonella sp.]|uniref:VIT domain-containing protein n=1 Tax=Dokdonella sp. TaxID=2291710 RepID=UPI00352957FE
MRGLLRSFIVFGLLLFVLQAAASAPQNTQAPYLTVVGEKVEHLPLASTQVDVLIAGVIADVTVKQVYENRGNVPIEALYVFPGSPRAAVYGLTMRVGDRLITAKIAEKEEARETYEAARAEGKTASLLEQLDPSIFRMNVANVLPGDRIEVVLKYTELLVPDRGTYEFVFPNTMGSRYGETLPVKTSSDSEVVDYAFSIHARIRSAIPLQDVSSPSHAVDVSYPNTMEADINLSEAEFQRAGAADYVLHYTLAGDAIQTGMLMYPAGDGGYFLMMAQPPTRVSANAVTAREFIFVIDVSGSMNGQPLDVSKRLIRDLFTSLRWTDRFNIVLFEHGSRVLSPKRSLTASPDNLDRVLNAVSSENAGGGTNLVAALETAYALPEEPGMARSVIVITDGQIAAGGEAFAVARSQLGRANTFAFGVGGNVNRPVIELLARAGNGEPFILENFNESDAVAERLRSYIDRPLLTNVSLRPEDLEAYDLEPSQVADLLAERPIIVVGRYRGPAQGAMLVSGVSGNGPYQAAVSPDANSISPQLSALRLLWARTRMQRLLDEQSSPGWGYSGGEPNAAEITELSLAYGLLSPYTSFVAVDEVVRADQAARSVQQPAISKTLESPEEPPLVAASPPPPPAPSYRSAGTGSAFGLTRTIGAALGASLVPSGSVTAVHTIGKRTFELRDATWTDLSYRDDMTLLRLRADSTALARLLEARPEWAAAVALGTRVIIVIGDVALLIAPEGFSDYPEATLQSLLRG